METLQILLPKKYGKYFSALLEYFFKHISLISKECALYQASKWLYCIDV